jgi:hypothetical protein
MVLSFVASFVVARFFDKHRAKTQFVIDQPKSVFGCKVRNLCPPVFYIFWPNALQFVFVDSAIAEFVGLQGQLTFD